MTIDKKVDCIKLAKEVVRQTRNDVLISKTQMTDIAARCNRNRTTVSRALDAEDMTLSMWFASVSESQIDPLELIAEKIREQSALADGSNRRKVFSHGNDSDLVLHRLRGGERHHDLHQSVAQQLTAQNDSKENPK